MALTDPQLVAMVSAPCLLGAPREGLASLCGLGMEESPDMRDTGATAEWKPASCPPLPHSPSQPAPLTRGLPGAWSRGHTMCPPCLCQEDLMAPAFGLRLPCTARLERVGGGSSLHKPLEAGRRGGTGRPREQEGLTLPAWLWPLCPGHQALSVGSGSSSQRVAGGAQQGCPLVGSESPKA